jgi:hypothetical protein
MKLHPESSLSLSKLKGAFAFTKEGGKEVTYRIYDFYIDCEPYWDENKMEPSGFELSTICVTLVPLLEDGKPDKDNMVGRCWSDVKDYEIQLADGFPHNL